ncbi:Phage head morphogenesis domain [uncultured Caudovirales phage]|uniref:Phage head morphogenesis domain n=1 Tax=uncultured Caudovirales phage TaxID=2100421 RepID=A0A6J5NDR3_9CAUD|nr:Phage head morphogenesis domain [uncultured Caudovirales phage]
MAIRFGSGNDGSRNPLTAEEAAMARALYNAIRSATDSIKVDELAKIISQLDADTLDRLLRSISIQGDSKKIENQLLNIIDVGGKDAIKGLRDIAPQLVLPAFIPAKVNVLNAPEMAGMDFTKIPNWARVNPEPVSFNLSFNKTNPNSVAFASRRAGQLVVSIDDLTRQSIRKIIVDSFNEGIDVRRTAVRIKNVVGLHPAWADAVTKFERRELDRLIKAGVKEAQALDRSQKAATAYADRLKTARAKTIARTEIQIAQNEGRMEGYNQAAEAGYIDPASMKMWITAPDERTCDICAPLDGQVVPWNGLFSIGLEKPIVHPNCRCTFAIIPPDRGTK